MRECGKGFPDCERCQENPTLRALWGCEEPAERPVFDVTCSRCGGADDSCKDCTGSGLFSFRTCPRRAIEEAGPSVGRNLNGVLRAYVQLDSRQVMPAPGGLYDQAEGFLRAVEIIDAERGRYERMRADRMERERKAAEARSRQKGKGRR